MRFSRTAAALPALALVLLSGCSDGPTDPNAGKLTLVMVRGSVPFEEETLAPGSTIDLDAQLLDASGEEVTVGAVKWTSDNVAVATVTETGLVTAGMQTGTALIIASDGTHADTGRVNVAQPVTGPVACAPDDPGIILPVGGTRPFSGGEALTLCIRSDGSPAEYALIGFNASVAAGARMDVRMAGSDVFPVQGPPLPSLSPTRRLIGARDLLEDEEFHERLLRGSRDEARLALRGGLRPSTPLRATAPALGDLMPLNVQSDPSKDACGTPDTRTGRVVAITERAIVVADTANPRNGFTNEDYRSIGVAFDTLVWRVSTENFGTPTDIDKNGKVILFYTRAVNELTRWSADSYVGGFFYNRDLFPKTGPKPCAGSNYAEMFYMLVPDPQGTVNGNPRTIDFVRNSTIGVLAHEFQHLINDSRRLYEHKSPVWEETWLNEGLSHIAEELVFFAAAGLGPRRNIGPESLQGRVREIYQQYAADNMGRLVRFLREPEPSSPMGNPDLLQTRGAIWAFLRYAADREPAADAGFWSRLVNSKTRGLENLQAALGADPREWMNDWAVAVYTDDAGIPVEARYQQPSWNYRLIIPATTVSAGQYPLRWRYITSAGITGPLAGGGAVYGRFAVLADRKGAVRTTVGGLPPPSRLRLTIVRTK